MRRRNWRIIASVIIGILFFVGIVIYITGKHSIVDDGANIPDAPLEQITEKPVVPPEVEGAVQTASSPETTDFSVTSTPTKRVYQLTIPPTEVPTPIPPTATPNPWKESEYSPTCEEAGYIVRENTLEGYTVIDEGRPALGHEYGEWKLDSKTGIYISICSRCGKEIKQRVPYNGTIPRIDLTGNVEGISKSDRVTLQFDFASPVESFTCFAYMSWQGHNSLNYPKKNFTVRLYDNKEITDKHKLIFQDWVREHKYVLKANYCDFSQSRNLIAANIWADMVASRETVFPTLRLTSNFGAVDGFPVIVYLNGDFIGLYTMNLHKDDDLYKMDDAYDAVLIANSAVPAETRFKANALFKDEKNAWEIEYCGTDDCKWAKDKLNELISFVMKSDDVTFRANIGNYLDVDAAIDYLIFIYVTGLKENAIKDLVLLKYHDCDVWIPSAYDMEQAFGLNNDGSAYFDAAYFLPYINNGTWYSDTDSLLWDRMLQSFESKLRKRYKDLRETILTEAGLKNRVKSFAEEIPKEYYEKDLLVWPRKLPDGEQTDQMNMYIDQRLRILDEIFIEN